MVSNFKKFPLRIFSPFFNALAFCTILITGCGKNNDNEAPAVRHETGTVTDIDGNTYATVKIGNQWWMAENLKVTKYRNGIAIPLLDSVSLWSSTSSGACWNYAQGAPGLLYNWYAISDTGRLAPSGWHIPSDDEWKQLETYLGMPQSEADKSGWRGTHEGEKLKVTGYGNWAGSANVWNTNESGFNALAGSCRLFNGVKGDPGLNYTGFWWTSSGNSENAFYRYLDYKTANVFRSNTDKNYGFSIRCVKD